MAYLVLPCAFPKFSWQTNTLSAESDSEHGCTNCPTRPQLTLQLLGQSITAGSLNTRGQRSNSSVSSIRSATSSRVGGIDNNVMASTSDRSRSRRERTFVGSECAVCEEPLEHTLRGERILQFSCSHVSHEACFYEFIREFESQYCPTCDAPLHLDTSRGGNVIDIGTLSNALPIWHGR